MENDSEVGGDIDKDNTEPDILHTVTFKCIGSVHDANAQDVLAKVSVA